MKCSSVDTISLDNIMPRFFSESDVQGSEVWKSDLVLHKGRYYMIEAASGKGKSSLCNFIFGLRKDYSGTIRFDGSDVAAFGPGEWRNLRRVSISMMFQDLDLFEELTALENIRIKNGITGYFSPCEIESLMLLPTVRFPPCPPGKGKGWLLSGLWPSLSISLSWMSL